MAKASGEDKTPETLRAERGKRIQDAVALEQPDRVPIYLPASYLLSEYGGVSNQEIQDDAEKHQQLLEKFALEFEPDNISGVLMDPGPSLVLGDRMTVWPGYGLPPSGQFQFVESEFMKAEDYPAFLRDPSDWVIRTYLPRAFEKFEALGSLPPMGMWAYGFFNLDNLALYGGSGVADAMTALGEAIKVAGARLRARIDSSKRMAAIGFPPNLLAGTAAKAPFDFMSDTLRGMRGIMLDMMRNPDELLEAEERTIEIQVEHARIFAKATGLRKAIIPLHRGSDGFMSLAQFERFYWPQLKRLLVALVQEDITPVVGYQGTWDHRLEYLTELPRAETVGVFQNTDIFKAKEVLGDTVCIMGGMPNSLLVGGSPEEIGDLTRKLCERVGKDGGYIMTTAVGEMSSCKLENVRAWVDATREFGRY